MRKFLAWLGFRRFIPNCDLCLWQVCNPYSCCAQGYKILEKAYGTNECYILFKESDEEYYTI